MKIKKYIKRNPIKATVIAGTIFGLSTKRKKNSPISLYITPEQISSIRDSGGAVNFKTRVGSIYVTVKED